MNASDLVIPAAFDSGPATIFQGKGADDDLGAGISVGFSLIGYKGKTWSIRHQGQEIPLLRTDGSGDPLNSIDLVVIKAPDHLSKVWYEATYQEGSNERPDCASSNGIVPDLGVPKKQNDVCLTCRWNAFGSRPAVAGQTQTFKGKACGDNKRLAVVPLGDIKNEQFGGPLLLRVPAASLADLQAINLMFKQRGFPYYAAGIKVSFDTTVAYPKFVFKPIRPLNDAEGKLVLDMRDLPLTDVIVHGDPAAQAPIPAAASRPASDNVVEMPAKQQPPTQAAPASATGFGGVAAAAPTTPAAPKTASGAAFGGGAQTNGVTSPVQEAAPEPTGVAQFDAALEKKLEGLL